MTTAVLLEPHQDDAALFAAFTCYANKPLVITVLRSDKQARLGFPITDAMRQNENDGAMMILGCDWEQWDFSDADPDWVLIEACVAGLASRFEHCYAPLPEPNGHPHHNAIGEAARRAFGDRVTFYTTYTNHRERTRGTVEVTPSPGALSAKLVALSCYTSQLEHEATRHHFMNALNEWYA